MDSTVKKIILVANTAWSMFNFRRGLLISLIEHGYQITIIAPSDDYSDRLRDMGCAVVDLAMSAKGVNPLQDIKTIYDLYKCYRRIQPDFVIHYTIKPNIYGSLAARLAGIPSLAVTTGLGYAFVNDNVITKIVHKLYKLAFIFPNEVWFLNDDDKAIFLQRRLVTSDKASILPSEGVDINYFTPREVKKNDDSIRFLLISRMLWDKGIGEFVSAAKLIKKKYPHAKFQLLGACGVANPSVIGREQIDEWESQGLIEYLGTTDDVRPLIANADCVVLPSFYREGVPRTLMEAAAMAKPLITTDNVGCRDVVLPGKTGFFCPIKNAQALADCCERIITMTDEQCYLMGVSGREFIVNKFEESLVIKKYLRTIDKYLF